MGRLTNIALNLVTIIITAGSIAFVTVRIKPDLFLRKTRAPVRKLVPDWRLYGTAGHREGIKDAPVTIVEFADFECPYCANAAVDLRMVRERYAGQVATIFRHFPISAHAHAGAAAKAAECAGEQKRFEDYSNLLYTAQIEIGLESWQGFAQKAGVRDIDLFTRCLSDDAVTARIIEDRKAGERLGVHGTPTFLINDVEVEGYENTERFLEIVRDALGQVKDSTTRKF